MYKRKDGYYKMAKAEGYSSRAAYKLKEINDKYKLIKKGDTVLDAGCAPGGWLQVLSEIVGNSGKIVGVDILDIKNVKGENIHFIKGDLTEAKTLEEVLTYSNRYHTVVSDAAPNTSGQKIVDHMNSLELVKTIFNFTKKVLVKNGNFLFKLFDGEDRDDFIKELKNYFKNVKILRPDATRKNSFEIYVICQGFSGNEQ
ncbi:RlmE family RNA methyltransferase [Deferribacterales bacterium Es71-Z0220]|uniref:RlmE family RNA methyltransferase n=1 Tax=Deferrivibrio essentukiensis TaxID=2880922 RepID=UPI001F60FDD0|nr:RlmE family RNA methyltransferase [Deferrivibrio essentukiensis]MCB4204048.1 RlmE family RNA methyltransferase [Deferrivibrio essentukiensis]